MAEYQTNPATCWHCHTELDGHMNVNGEGKPESGDLSICIYCGAWGVVQVDDDNVILTVPDTETWVALTTTKQRIETSYIVAKFREANHIGVPEK